MTAKHRFRILAAALAILGPAMGCRAMPLGSPTPAAAVDRPRSEAPHPGIWVAYSARGADSSTTPNADGTQLVSAGHSQWPLFSVRLNPTATDVAAEVDLLTPAGFDRDLLVADPDEEAMAGSLHSDSDLHERRLKRALMHHRPSVRLRLDSRGEAIAESSAEIRHHEACARRLLRAAIEAQLAAAEEEEHRRDWRKQLQAKDLAQSVAPPIDSARLLLRLARLPLPRTAGAYHPGGAYRTDASDPSPDQRSWRMEQIKSHGLAVRSEIDLLSAPDSAAASLCRSLAYESAARLRRDSCIIQGAIDGRDGWPIRLTISRRGEAADGATEGRYRSFDRLAPLQGFVAPPDPCSAGR